MTESFDDPKNLFIREIEVEEDLGPNDEIMWSTPRFFITESGRVVKNKGIIRRSPEEQANLDEARKNYLESMTPEQLEGHNANIEYEEDYEKMIQVRYPIGGKFDLTEVASNFDVIADAVAEGLKTEGETVWNDIGMHLEIGEDAKRIMRENPVGEIVYSGGHKSEGTREESTIVITRHGATLIKYTIDRDMFSEYHIAVVSVKDSIRSAMELEEKI